MLGLLDRGLTAFENFCLAAGTAVAVTVATVQVILRYVGGTGLFWAEELVVYTIVWTTFLAAGAAVRSGEHLTVELINLAVGERYIGVLTRVIGLIGAVAGVALTVFGTELVLTAQDYGQLSPALQLPMWIVYLAMPVSGLLMTIRFLQQMIAPPRRSHAPAQVEDVLCP
jgi:C4-dicarboxylate transporter DctQ subunit